MKIRWPEVLYIVLLVLCLGLYVYHPARRAQWREAGQWWRGWTRDRGVAGGTGPFQGETVLLPPVDFSESVLEAQARFSGGLEYLGCDRAVTQGDSGEIHVWLLTYWRGSAQSAGTYRVRFSLSGADGETTVAIHHPSRPFLGGEGRRVADTILLPDRLPTDAVVGVEVQIESSDALTVTSPLLYVERGTRLIIWQR